MLLLGGIVFLCAGDICFAYFQSLGEAHLDPFVHATFVLAYGLDRRRRPPPAAAARVLRRASVPEPHEESVSVFDAEGRVVGALPRAQAKRSRLAVGAVNVLLVNARGEVLLQRRPEDKENGGRWDKTVGGHVDEGETFDEAAVREAGEELFGDGASPRVRLARDEAELGRLLADGRPRPRRSSSGGRRSSSTCGTCGSGRAARGSATWSTTWRATSGAPTCRSTASGRQADEIAGLRYAAPAEVDALLVARRARAEHGLPLAHPRPGAARARRRGRVTGWERPRARALGATRPLRVAGDAPARGGGARPARRRRRAASSCSSSGARSTRRTRGRGTWASPGGAAEPGDADLAATAVRETLEETGLDLARDGERLGALDEVTALARGRPVDLVIAPFVFRLRRRLDGAPEPRGGEPALAAARAAPGARDPLDAAVPVRGDGARAALPAHRRPRDLGAHLPDVREPGERAGAA